MALKAKYGKTPILDVGTFAKIRSGEVKVKLSASGFISGRISSLQDFRLFLWLAHNISMIMMFLLMLNSHFLGILRTNEVDHIL